MKQAGDEKAQKKYLRPRMRNSAYYTFLTVEAGVTRLSTAMIEIMHIRCYLEKDPSKVTMTTTAP